ncbi:hypothetical protein [Flammeovirga aprica]|uniref:Uncharacterized protein n=1 Tax=Flammeovirga aprica JL-4 TaxID=694437 RepID=A0A7X9S2G9_9BACT|nr:hypothetical protein [Flammeovirga aprica]NME73174.1 hypothetical protein [Flammeovirga aprica JL-4]
MNLFFYTLYGELINFIREQNIPLIDPSNFEITGMDFLFLPEAGGKSALEAAELAGDKILRVLRDELGDELADEMLKKGEFRVWFMNEFGEIKKLVFI